MNARRIAGKAMFTIVTSRNTMNTASADNSSTFHSRRKLRRRAAALASPGARFAITCGGIRESSSAVGWSGDAAASRSKEVFVFAAMVDIDITAPEWLSYPR